jgi:hypothetical protein
MSLGLIGTLEAEQALRYPFFKTTPILNAKMQNLQVKPDRAIVFK